MERPVRLLADRLPSPIGRLVVICSDAALCVLDFGDDGERLGRYLMRRFGARELVAAANPLGVTAKLARYLDGDPIALDDVPVDPGGTAYQRRVWDELRTIPYGRTQTYGALAARIGGTHARAVGQANALNPVAIVIPCHRVIGADATLTGYAGGLERKRWLLDHETARAAPRLPLTLFGA